MIVKSIRHTGIVVTNLEQSLYFYTQKLGFKIFNKNNESGVFLDKIIGLDNARVITVKLTLEDGQMIELLDFTSHKKKPIEKRINDIGPTHLAFTVSNIDDMYNDFIDSGIEFTSNPEISPDGLVKVAFCKAPEGTYIELVQALEE
jgi:catechol 2,3-dioxygenase-like lactoylglutathione lyase family enzyme